MSYTRVLLRAGFVIAPVVAVTIGVVPAAQGKSAPQAQRALTAAQAKALSMHVTDKVIVVFNNQLAALPDTATNQAARSSAVGQVQRSVRSELTATHARAVKSLSVINAVSATVSAGEAQRLKANPAVARVVKDEPIPLIGSKPTLQVTPKAGGFKAPPNACPAKGGVQLNPQAIETIHAAGQNNSGKTAEKLGYTGKGVKVAYIADGVNTNNPDFIRSNGKHVFVDNQDFSGTGTSAPTGGGEAFLDSSSIAAQGRHIYNLNTYGTGLKTSCRIKIRGVAPGASLVGLNVFGSAEEAFNSVFLEAINYAVNTDHVKVLNESFGANPFPDSGSLDLDKMANDAAVKAGVTVTVSTGDAGVTNTIGSPATDSKVISAGASTTYRSFAQSDIGGFGIKGVTGWLNNNISGLSSAGFAQDASTVDVVAPGDSNWALCTPKPAKFADCTDFEDRPAAIELTGGTSESAPLTAGVAALVIQAYAKTHGGHDPSPAVVKRIIVSTASDIQAPAEQQGAGLINAYQAVRAAASYPGATKSATGHAVLDSATQFTATGQPSSSQQFSETLTNDGSGPATVKLSSRALSSYTPVLSKSVSLTSANGDFVEVPFTVPSGRARLNASVALKDGFINLSLIDPSGRLAENNSPQGVSNYANAQVARPEAGKWKALIEADFASKSIPAVFQASTATWQPFGSLSTSTLTIPAKGSQSFSLTVPTPANPGDSAGSIVLHTLSGSTSESTNTIPVTLRSLVPTPAPTTTFSGNLTGGNGRSTATGQTAYYQFQVPTGLPELNAQISTPNSANSFFAELIDPATGEAASTAANSTTATTSGGETTLRPQQGTQLHVLTPAPGTWTLIIDFYNTVSGTAVSQPFTVTLDRTPATASATSLPTSTATHLTAGQPVTVNVQVTNTGNAPEAYFIDGRFNTQTTTSLAAQDGANVELPNLANELPTYVVPTHTTALAAAVTAKKPLFFDFTWWENDPDVMSSTPLSATNATGSLSAARIAQGDWFITPFLTGPTGVKQAKSVLAKTSLVAATQGFDPAVSSPTGDLWLSSIHPSAGFTPVIVDPAQTTTIPVTIVPKGASGTVVAGTLYLDDASLMSSLITGGVISDLVPEGSDVAAFPYTYTIQ
jgi:subtilisin family serine protease